MEPLFCKRFAISIILWLVFWVICIALASGSNPWIWSLSNPLFWSILINRFTIWFIVWIIWIYKYHPLFGFRFYPVLRGLFVWALISMQVALWVLFSPMPDQMMIFWSTIIVWAIYWMIIDLVATYFGWEGVELLDKR